MRHVLSEITLEKYFRNILCVKISYKKIIYASKICLFTSQAWSLTHSARRASYVMAATQGPNTAIFSSLDIISVNRSSTRLLYPSSVSSSIYTSGRFALSIANLDSFDKRSSITRLYRKSNRTSSCS